MGVAAGLLDGQMMLLLAVYSWFQMKFLLAVHYAIAIHQHSALSTVL